MFEANKFILWEIHIFEVSLPPKIATDIFSIQELYFLKVSSA